MQAQRIAIIGLGRIGSAFLKQMLEKRKQGIELICVAEQHDTPGKHLALEAQVPIKTLDEIVALGPQVDVIFDVTGIPGVRRELREKLAASFNLHTVIASETIVRVIWALITSEDLPEIEGRKTGY
ncbi:MAG: NAD(P)-binding domain-containing protein [Burkholderiales bacterium]|nr:NAD(P)-binding domain-containing protein [Burkholderiales bacterium]